jgi:ATP-dependent Clp protease ATP-binding subunit ClpC
MVSITIRVPFALTRLRDGLCEAIPLTSRGIRTIATTPLGAIRIASKRFIENYKGLAPEAVARCCVTEKIEARTLSLELSGEKPSHRRQSLGYREPIDLTVSTFGWTCGPGLVYSVAPRYDVQVISADREDADNLVIRQVRQLLSAKLAEDTTLLAGLLVRAVGEPQVIWQSLPIEVAELGKAKQDDTDHTKATAALKKVATRWAPTKLRRAYHRDDIVNEFIDWIAGDESRSVLLVGRSGVGKTAIVHEAIRRLSETMQSPPKFYATDGSRLIAGQCGFGMLQEQCLQAAAEIERLGAILHLGNLMQLIESGKINGSGGCASILTPRISSGRLTAIIEATPEEIGLAQRIEPRLMAALETLHIDEPDSETTRLILMESALNWQTPNLVISSSNKKKKEPKANEAANAVNQAPQPKASRPQFDVDALIAIDQLHRRFPTDSASPGRPLAFLSGVGGELSPSDTLTADLVNKAFTRQTGLPSFLTDSRSRPDLEQIQRSLSNDVIGQPHAIEAVVDTIATLATWLSRGDRPLASLLLIGPTGVGKTETAKSIARLIYHDPARMIRIDLSEYSTPDATRRLIGDSCGGEGLLTGAIRAQPFSLVLLDEFEKADRSVFDLLLQVLGEGRLTDARGRLADFRNSIVLMTSNLGVESYRGTQLGLVDTQLDEARRLEKHFDQQVRSFLRPEMYNRIDRIIAYRPLSTETIKTIAQSRIGQLEQRDGVASRAGRLMVNEEAMARLVATGYEPQYGARPLARTIEREIVTPLAEALCENRSTDAMIADIGIENESLHVNIAADSKASEVSPRKATNRIAVLMLATQTRRHFQALLRTPQMIALQNRETMHRRLFDQQMHAAKSEASRSRILGSPLYQSWLRDQTQIESIQQLGSTIAELERTIALAHYRHEPQVVEPMHAQLMAAEQELIDCVINLVYDGHRLDQPISMVISSRELSRFIPTIQAYVTLASKNDWQFQAFAILRAEDTASARHVMNATLGKREPAFMIEVQKHNPEEDESPTGNSVKASQEPTKMAAFAIPTPELPQLLNEASMPILLQIEGRRAWAYLSNEAGLHMVLPADAVHKKQALPMTCEAYPLAANKVTFTNDGTTHITNKAPAMRRYHDAKNQTMRDHVLATTFHCGAEPQARIEQAIDDCFHKRIMELLIDAPSDDKDEAFATV